MSRAILSALFAFIAFDTVVEFSASLGPSLILGSWSYPHVGEDLGVHLGCPADLAAHLVFQAVLGHYPFLGQLIVQP